MTRIQVETAKLEQLSRDLNLLRFEFEGIGDRVEDYREALGRSGKLADALDDVATNWSKKRGKIVEALQAFSESALHAARHYKNTSGRWPPVSRAALRSDRMTDVWSPLADEDPVPGDPWRLGDLANHFDARAETIRDEPVR